MTLRANFYMALTVFFFLFLPVNQVFADNSEVEELKQQLKQMQTQMELMERKIHELETKKEIPMEETDEVRVERRQFDPAGTPIGLRTTPERQTGFFGQALQSMNPAISVIGIFSAAYYSEDEPLVRAEGDPEDTGVNLQELEIGFQSIVDPYFRFDTFLSITPEEFEIEEAYGTTLLTLPLNSQIRAGLMRSKFGRINTQHRHDHEFVTLPLVATRFLGEHLNPIGIEANFLLPTPWFSELTMAVNSPDVETASFERDADSNNLGRLLYNFHLSNFFDVSESFGFILGGSFATGPNATDVGNRTNLFGVDLFAKYRPLRDNPFQEIMFQGEFMYRDAETLEGTLRDYGFYTQVIYRFAQRWRAGIRFGMTDTRDAIEFDDDHHDEEHHDEDHHERAFVNSSASPFAGITNNGDDDHHHGDDQLGLFGREYRISPMLTFSPTEFSYIRLQYDYTDQKFDRSQHAVFLQFMYAIGAHGAHPF